MPAELAQHCLSCRPARSRRLAPPQFPLLVPRSFVRACARAIRTIRCFAKFGRFRRSSRRWPASPTTRCGEQGLATEGFIRKYPGRALLIASGACPVHCRYCFRREFPYQTQLAARSDWAEAIEQLRGTADVREVILSGGDPLSLSNRRLSELFAKLADTGVAHRAHPIRGSDRRSGTHRCGLVRFCTTRACGTSSWCTAITPNSSTPASRRLFWRCASPRSLAEPVGVAARRQRRRATLAALSERLFSCGTLPYYLHLLDPVAGAAHFDVDEQTGNSW